jgi:hypothetical protein
MPPRIDISDLYTWEEYLPRPQWDLIADCVRDQIEAEVRAEVWADIARQWLARLGESLDGGYGVHESPHFLVLAADCRPSPATLLALGEQCRQSLGQVLPGLARFRGPGKQVAIVLDGDDAYYQYLSVYYGEGHHGASSGVQIREGYSHIVICHRRNDAIERTLAHELMHSALSHLTMPQWIEEGLAQLFERDMAGGGSLLLDPKQARKHKTYWGRNGLEAFWRGDGFSQPGTVQELSYQLAEVLIRILIEDHRPRWMGLSRGRQQQLMSFFREADAMDCGHGAAVDHLGFGLSNLAAKFLGPGEWGVPL